MVSLFYLCLGEELVFKSLGGSNALLRVVVEEFGKKIDGVGVVAAKNFLESFARSFGKAVSLGFGDFLDSGCSEDFEHLDEHVAVAVASEEDFAGDHFSHDAADGPSVDGSSVLSAVEEEFRRSVVAGADVRDGSLSSELLGASEVADLDDSGSGVAENVFGFEIAVGNVFLGEVGECREDLLHVESDGAHGELVLADGVVHVTVDTFHAEVEVDVTVLFGVELIDETDDAFVLDSSHDVDLAVLVARVLEDLLDRDHRTGFGVLGECHDSEGTFTELLDGLVFLVGRSGSHCSNCYY